METPRPVPAAPGRVPGLGHVPALLRDPLGFLGSLARVGDVAEIRLGRRAVCVVTSPALVHTLLTAHAHDCPRGAVQQTLREAFGDGLLASEGRVHRDRRRILQPAFTPDRIARYAPAVQEVTRARIARWHPGRPLDVAAEMHQLALELVTRALFRTRLREESARAFQRALPDLVKGQLLQSLYPHPALARLPLPVNRRFEAAVRALDQVVDQAVSAPAAAAADSSVLSLLRTATGPATGGPLDAAAVRSEVISLFGAGTETVSTTLTWLFHELLRHPDLHARLLAELDSTLGPGSGPELTPAVLEELPLLRNVLREVLRLHAPNAFLMRTAQEDVQLGPYAVPAGTELLYSLTALHRDPTRYPQPLRFRPERWDGGTAPGRHAFLPFGAGRHRCIGEAFAWLELAVVTATVLRTWRLLPVAGSPAKEVVWTTVQARGLSMTPAPRTVP